MGPHLQFAFSPTGKCRALDTLYIDLAVDIFFMVTLSIDLSVFLSDILRACLHLGLLPFERH
jgi:hypothetical protein